MKKYIIIAILLLTNIVFASEAEKLAIAVRNNLAMQYMCNDYLYGYTSAKVEALSIFMKAGIKLKTAKELINNFDKEISLTNGRRLLRMKFKSMGVTKLQGANICRTLAKEDTDNVARLKAKLGL